ncbi:hypothetical protein A4A49_06870 [Nicotiana attenuata]|uniref:Uncharacterized protein n=1 Tax=Nicotiana attenuata TaxID=49451 RepID=A0A1J6ITR8_NICAT|nr:hypothetical protein A4A49_06870 [Nicotiana attenuata]
MILERKCSSLNVRQHQKPVSHSKTPDSAKEKQKSEATSDLFRHQPAAEIAGSKSTAGKQISQVLEGEKQAANGLGVKCVQARITDNPVVAGHIKTRQQVVTEGREEKAGQVFANLISANIEKDSKNKKGQLVVIEDECKVSWNSIAPATVNLTAIGAKILESMNPLQVIPLQVLPGFVPNPMEGLSLQEVKENNEELANK